MLTKMKINVTLWTLVLPCVFVLSTPGFAEEKTAKVAKAQQTTKAGEASVQIAAENLFSDELDERDAFGDDQDDQGDDEEAEIAQPPQKKPQSAAEQKSLPESVALAEGSDELDSTSHPVRQETGQGPTSKPVQQKVDSSNAPKPVRRTTNQNSGARPVQRNVQQTHGKGASGTAK